MQNLIIGTNGQISAVDPATGTEIWRTPLERGIFQTTTSEDVSVVVKEGRIYAGCRGHLFALAADSGQILWHNDLKGMGHNDISLAFEGISIQYLQKTVHQHVQT